MGRGVVQATAAGARRRRAPLGATPLARAGRLPQAQPQLLDGLQLHGRERARAALALRHGLRRGHVGLRLEGRGGGLARLGRRHRRLSAHGLDTALAALGGRTEAVLVIRLHLRHTRRCRRRRHRRHLGRAVRQHGALVGRGALRCRRVRRPLALRLGRRRALLDAHLLGGAAREGAAPRARDVARRAPVRQEDAPAVPGDEAQRELARGRAAPLHELDALEEQRRGLLDLVRVRVKVAW